MNEDIKLARKLMQKFRDEIKVTPEELPDAFWDEDGKYWKMPDESGGEHER